MQVAKHLRERNCPVCGDNEHFSVAYPSRINEQELGEFAFASRKVPEFMHLRLLRCRTCGVLYASPALSPEFLAEAYRSAAYDSGEEAGYAARGYSALLRRALPPSARRGSAIEVGAGNGAFLRHLLRAGFDSVVGIEPSHRAAAAAKETTRRMILVRMFRTDDFEPASFDLFCCFQTLEHVESPRELCSGAYNLLRPGGAIFLVAHDYESWLTWLMGEKSPIFDIEHLQLFSRKSLRYLLESCHFRDVRLGAVSNRYPLSYWIKLLPIDVGLRRQIVRFSRSLLVGRVPLGTNVGNIYALGFKRPL